MVADLITIMDVICGLIKGNTFGTREDLLAFRELCLMSGIDPTEFDNSSVLLLLQQVCAKYAELDLV